MIIHMRAPYKTFFSILLSIAFIILSLNLVSAKEDKCTKPQHIDKKKCLNEVTAYVTNQTDNTITVIDVATGTATTEIDVDAIQPLDSTISPDKTRLYVTNFDGKGATIIDTATNTVLQTITGFASPRGIAATNNYFYVGDSNLDVVKVYDSNTFEFVNNIHTGTGSGIYGVAINPTSTAGYVASNFQLDVFNPLTNTYTTSIETEGTSPVEVIISPDGTRAYISYIGSAFITVVDLVNNSVITNIPFSRPYGIAISPDGETLYAINIDEETVGVINANTFELITSISVGSVPRDVDVTPNGDQLYVTNQFSNNVLVIDIATNSVINTIPVGGNPSSVVFK